MCPSFLFVLSQIVIFGNKKYITNITFFVLTRCVIELGLLVQRTCLLVKDISWRYKVL